MSLIRTSVWTTFSILIKIGVGLLVIKLLAMNFGTEGVGQAGNFRQLISVLAVLSGAGIFNGITKYVAEYQKQPILLHQVISSASAIILLFSLALSLLFFFLAGRVSYWLFESEQYKSVIIATAFIQFFIAGANFCLAILKGFHDSKSTALSVVIGSLLGAIFYTISYYLYDYQGALIGLAMIPAITLIPAAWFLYRRNYFDWTILKPSWYEQHFRAYSKYMFMTITTCITMPLAYVMMRNLLAEYYSWHQVGLWQGMSTISDAYLQFVTAIFSVYLLPKLATLFDHLAIRREIVKVLMFIFPIVTVIGCILWSGRDWIIRLLFSQDFTQMRELFIWQVCGDVLKVGSYVFGYFIIAKAMFRIYLLAELTQFILLLGLAYHLIPHAGAVGAVQAYCITYILYFPLCVVIFYFYSKKTL